MIKIPATSTVFNLNHKLGNVFKSLITSWIKRQFNRLPSNWSQNLL